jgi:hypothetical protein
MKTPVRRVWVQVRKLKYDPQTHAARYDWENQIAAPLDAARGHEQRIAEIIGRENVRIAHNEKGQA